MRTLKLVITKIAPGLVGLCAFYSLALGAGDARFQELQQYSRLSIPAAAGSTFRLIGGSAETTTLIIDRVRPENLAALSKYSDNRVESVQVKPAGLDTAELTIRFREKNTESFAYHQGGMVVLDLWKGEAKAAPATVAIKLPAAVKKMAIRQPASVKPAPKKVAPAVAALSRESDVFQRYVLPMPELRLEARHNGMELPPKVEIEGLYEFSKGNKSTDPGKAFEFAKKLFKEKNYGLAVKAIEIANRDNPKNPYKGEMRFLLALAYRRLAEVTGTPSLGVKAESQFQELAKERNEAGVGLPFHRAIQTYFGERDYVAGRYLEAIENLEAVSKGLDANHPDYPYVQMMVAESYGRVGQNRRAERIYRYLTEKFPKHILAKEAQYRIVDLLAGEKNYGRVVEEGEVALSSYPDYEKNRSEVQFNIGEAHFWLKNYKEAEKAFRRYADIGSAQTNASLAWLRLGEISEVAKGDTKAAKELYLKAKDGYPFSAGDLSATVRLARLNLPTEKDRDFILARLNEILLDKNTDEDLHRMAEFTQADYLLANGEGDRSLEIARNGMAQTEGVPYENYKQAYTRAIFAKLNGMAKEKHFAEALALYDKEKKWFELYGPESFRVMADVYRGLGLYATANEYMEKYAKGSGRNLASNPKGRLELELSRAKNSFARGAYAETLQLLPEDDDANNLAMRAISTYRLGKKREAYPLAVKALASEVEEISESTAVDLMEICLDWDQQDREYARMEKDLDAAAKHLKEGNERLAFARGDAAWYQKNYAAADKLYGEATVKFPKGERSDRARYNRGMSLINLGRNQEAVKVLTALRDSGQNVWAESAKQELELMNWEKKYSSVLKTLPPSGLGVGN